MSPAHRYPDFPELVAKHLRDFKSCLIYDPASPADKLIGIKPNTLSVSANALCIDLPLMFSLIIASQLQICVVNGHGELSVKTRTVRRGHQQSIINQGASYSQIVQMMERDHLERWRNQIFERIVNGHI
jgi:hypothetical protein